jgi:hypothetical protein
MPFMDGWEGSQNRGIPSVDRCVCVFLLGRSQHGLEMTTTRADFCSVLAGLVSNQIFGALIHHGHHLRGRLHPLRRLIHNQILPLTRSVIHHYSSDSQTIRNHSPRSYPRRSAKLSYDPLLRFLPSTTSHTASSSSLCLCLKIFNH